jgi:hypothetical protein
MNSFPNQVIFENICRNTFDRLNTMYIDNQKENSKLVGKEISKYFIK